MTKPVADYTPCTGCGHPMALHSDRGCHVIAENRAPKHKPNVTCGCEATANSESTVVADVPVRKVELPAPTGQSIATEIHHAVAKIRDDRTYRPPVLDAPAPLKPRDEKQQWVKEQRR